MRPIFLIAILLLISTSAYATSPNGVSGDFSRGVVLLGSGTANCNGGNTGAIRYNSTTPGVEYCNGTSWKSAGGGGMTLISTQTASASASLQFSGANWSSSYNTLFLNCSGILLTANGHNVSLEVGEGAGPTWETGAHYSQIPDSVTTSQDIFDGMYNQNSTADPISFYFYIHNAGSSTVHKMFDGSYAFKNANFNNSEISAYWNNDTNPLTGVELVANGTTIASGTCSLYGIN